MLKNKLNKTLVILAITSFTTSAIADEKSSNDLAVSVLHCKTPIKKIFVGKVTCKASSCMQSETPQGGMSGLAAMIQMAQAQQLGVPTINASGLNSTLSEMFSSTLRETGCFDIIDQEGIAQIKEQMAAIGKEYKPDNNVDLIINGTITSIKATQNDQHVLWMHNDSSSTELTLDTKVLDAHSAKIVGGGAFTGTSEKSSTNLDLGLFKIGQRSESTPLESVAREAIIRATNSIVTQFALDKK